LNERAKPVAGVRDYLSVCLSSATYEPRGRVSSSHSANEGHPDKTSLKCHQWYQHKCDL